MQEVVIVGAGAMGCLFAAKLAEAGTAVTLVDVDDARLAALARDGITLADDDGERVVGVQAKRAVAVTGPVDLVLLFTKAMHSHAAIETVGHLAQPHTYALTLQNGLGNGDALASVFAADRILLGVTDLPADLKGATHVSSHGHGTVRLGAGRPEGDDGALAAVALIKRAGIDAIHDAAVEAAIWEKVAFNAALNSLATVTGLTVGDMNTPPGRRIAFAIAREVAATATAKGLAVDLARIEAKIDFALTHHRAHKASMLQDRLAGRRTEIDSINGAVAREAEALGIGVPVTTTLADLVRLGEPW